METLKGACIFGQSGGPTSVINASGAGVFIAALKNPLITEVYGSANGIRGILEENFYDMRKEDVDELERLTFTPSSALGSVRYKLKPAEVDEKDYKKLLEVFKKYDIRYFFYNGGNDSMDTCNKVSKYMQKSGWECRVMGVPKTIDNDLYGTDHCPGFGSAAKYVATTMMELKLDATVYDTPMITVVEIMGRNAGWLTASAALAEVGGLGPDLIYLPEVAFDLEKFKKDVKAKMDENNGKCMIAVSEGIKDKSGKYIAEVLVSALDKDGFGHAQLGGVGVGLANYLKGAFGVKTRGIEFSLMQRCAAHIGSLTDIMESFDAGQAAVEFATKGMTDKMVIIVRENVNGEYSSRMDAMDVALCANTEKTVPLDWITKGNTYVSKEFIDYALPLIQGETMLKKEDGLPRFARLKKVQAGKRI